MKDINKKALRVLIDLRDFFAEQPKKIIIENEKISIVNNIINIIFDNRKLPFSEVSSLSSNEDLLFYINKTLSYLQEETNILKEDWRGFLVIDD